MSNINELEELMNIELLRDELEKNLDVVKLDRRGQHIHVRCPYCGDSDNPNEAHLAIRISDPDAIIWHCVRCDASGLFNTKLLDDLRLSNDSLTDLAMENVKESRRSKGHGAYNKRYKKRPIFFKTILNTKSAEKKLKYMQERFDRDFSYNDLFKYRVVFDFATMLKQNNLELNGISPDTAKALHRDAIGFMTLNGSMVNFRDISNTWDHRYFLYKLYRDTEPVKFFAMEKQLDRLTPILNLVMCEGCMDLIGVVETFYPDAKEDPSYAFVSCGGKSFPMVMDFFRTRGFLNIQPVIYADNDTDISLYKSIKRQDVLLYDQPMHIYFNTYGGEKDFGVPSNKIKLSTVKI